MWIKTKDGDAVNFDKVSVIKWYFNVEDVATVDIIIDDEEHTLGTFDNSSDAQAYVDMLVDVLNGKKPIDYSFSWLKNHAATKAKPTETVKNEKPADEDLIDGVGL